MPKVVIGTVSEGTLRTEDLLRAFTTELTTLLAIPTPVKDHLLLLSALHLLESDHEWNDKEAEDASWIVSELQEALNELCPPFVYFGAVEGDGADFGFWPDLGSLQEAISAHSGGFDLSDPHGEHLLSDEGIIVQFSDHGNILVLDAETRDELWSIV